MMMKHILGSGFGGLKQTLRGIFWDLGDLCGRGDRKGERHDPELLEPTGLASLISAM